MAERSPPFLRNSYWVLRHGKSIPNEKGLIVSSMENGILPEFGLAPEGVEQARLAGELFDKVLKEKNIQLENVRVCYSPFTRTTNTAKVAADVLGIPSESSQFKVMPELRERFFGPSLELLSHEKAFIQLNFQACPCSSWIPDITRSEVFGHLDCSQDVPGVLLYAHVQKDKLAAV